MAMVRKMMKVMVMVMVILVKMGMLKMVMKVMMKMEMVMMRMMMHKQLIFIANAASDDSVNNSQAGAKIATRAIFRQIYTGIRFGPLNKTPSQLTNTFSKIQIHHW